MTLTALAQAVSWDGFTPIHAAAAYGHAAVLHLLLTFGGDAKLATPSGVRPVLGMHPPQSAAS